MSDKHLRRGSRLVLVGMALLLAAGSARAQNTGSIFGTVKDTSGALVPHAQVVVVDKEHGLTRSVKTNGTGEFNLAEMPVGTYDLTVTMAGFETAAVNGILLDAQQNQKEVIVLRAGSQKDTVTVESESAVLDTKSGTVGAVIDNQLVENLPIDGENVVALAALLPGVTDVTAPTQSTSDTNGNTFSANGGRTNQNLMLFDGMMFNNLFYNTGIVYPPHPALQEASALLNNYTAEYGRSAGAIFNVLTKSGTDQFHGEVWEYLQNQMFNASDYLTHQNPEDNFNQFGATIGGPIKHDKLYFFVAYQQIIGHEQQVSSDTTPSNADRGLMPDGKTALPCLSYGAFPGLTCANFTDQVQTATGYNKLVNPNDAGGSSGSQGSQADTISMYNAAWAQYGHTGQNPCLGLLQQADNYATSHGYYGKTGSSGIQPTYLPWGEVPTQCLNPTMAGIIGKYVPLPNNVIGTGTVDTVTSLHIPVADKNLLIRGDYHLSRHTVDARYNLVRTHITSSLGGDIVSYNPDAQYAILNFGSIGDTWVLTNSMLNKVRVGYKRFENGYVPTDHTTMESFGGSFPVPGAQSLPEVKAGFDLGTANQGFLDTINENVEVQDSMSWSKGRHNFVWGFNFLRLQYLNRSDYAGQFTFSSSFTRVSQVDGQLGLVKSMNAQSRLNQGGIQHDVFGFFQDAWRATANLTVNYGVRYELPFQWFEPHGESATFVPGAQSQVFPNAPGGLVFPGDKGVLPSLVPTDYNGIAPRLGIAYDVGGNGKLIVRTGGGIFFDAVNANVVGVGEPYHYIINASYPVGGFSNGLLGYPSIPAQYDPKHPLFLAPYSIFFPDRNFRTPYIEAFNLGFQYRLSRSGTLETNYVGRLSRKLPIPLDLNPDIYDCSGGYFQSDPARYCTNAASTDQSRQARVRYADFNYGGQGIVDIKSVGNGNYNAWQTMYRQRGGKMLNMMASYTWSKSIDLSTNGQTTSNAAPNVFNINSDRGLSDTYSKHIFSMGWVMKFPRLVGGNVIERAVLNNWVFSGKYQVRSGHPYTVKINDDQALNGEPNQRAALVPGANPKLPSNRHRLDRIQEWFNIYAFTYPAQGTFSNVPRNAFIGPAFQTTDMNIGREFSLQKIREGMRMTLRMEGFNVFNTPNLGKPNSSFSCQSTNLYGGPCQASALSPNAGFSATSTFGKVTQTQGNNGNTQTTGRKMQFALTIFY